MHLQNSIGATCWLPHRRQVSWEVLPRSIVNYTCASLSLWSGGTLPSSHPKIRQKCTVHPFLHPSLSLLVSPHSHKPSLRLFACLSPYWSLNLDCLFSSYFIPSHTIYSSDSIMLREQVWMRNVASLPPLLSDCSSASDLQARPWQDTIWHRRGINN